MVHWRMECQTTPVFLSREPHGQCEKAKRYDTGRWAAQVRRCPICYWGSAYSVTQSCPTLWDPIDWCLCWNSNTVATWCKELTHLKRPWCWERLKVRGKGDDRGWDSWMASLMQWTWVWASSRRWWWTGKPGMLQSMGLQRVGHDWATELNWTVIVVPKLKNTG